MVASNVYIYLGYKLSENDIKNIFDCQEYIKYCEEIEKKRYKRIHKNLKGFTYNHKFDKYTFSDFINNKLKEKYGLKNKCDGKIEVYQYPCCLYDSNKYWIIGILKSIINIFDLEIVKWNQPNEEDFTLINKLKEDYNLKFGDPVLYSCPDDCNRCT